MWRSGLTKKLEKIVGREAMLDNLEQLRRYQFGASNSPPQFVCLPHTAQQISQILQAAIENKTAVVTQIVEDAPNSALREKYVYLDLCRFNKIVQIDSINLRAVVQPAVTLTALRKALAPREIDIPVLDTEVATIGTIRGLHNAVARLEVVLPNGRIANLSRHSTAGYCLTELFLESQSTLGILTEMTLELGRLRGPAQLTTSVPHYDQSSEAELYGRIQHTLNQHAFLNPQSVYRQG